MTPTPTLALRLVTLTAATSLVLAACGGDGGSGDGTVACSTDANDYVPAQVDGQDVERKDDVTQELESSLRQEGVDSIASGVVYRVVEVAPSAPASTDAEPAPTTPDGQAIPSDDPTQKLPDLVMVAGVGQGVAGTPGQFEQMKDQPDTQVDETVIDGVEVTTLTFPKAQMQTAISFGSPCETVFAISFAFKGGRDASELGMKAMLDNAG